MQTSVTDACAADEYYHRSCYTQLKNSARSAKSVAAKNECPIKDEGYPYDPLIFSQLLAYIQHVSTPVKLIELQNKYQQKLLTTDSKWTLKCEPYQVYSTKKDLVLSAKQGCNISPLEPCLQEEADTRIMLHLFHAAEQGHKVAFVRNRGTKWLL